MFPPSPDSHRIAAASERMAKRPSATVPAPAPHSDLSQPNPRAIELFRTAMEALQGHAYRPARELFQALLDRFPAERALTERTRVYLDLCERELRRRPADPRTMEERLTAATAALNSGSDMMAERLARSALAEEARQDLALYILAVIEARRG